MKRYPAYDPPEYLPWSPDPRLLDQFRRRIGADPERAGLIRALSEEQLLALYAGLLRNRLHDLTLKRWVRGGACHEMGMPVADMLRGYLGTADSPSRGRDGHVGDPAHGVVPPISHVGEMVPVCAGIALAMRQRGEDRVVLTWIGDGSTKTGAFHEGINLAAVHRLPLVCIIHNNQVALGTRLEQHSAGSFAHWPAMYGVAGGAVDGNHVLDAYAATRLAVERARAGDGVTLLAAETFRMGGHATHDEREARQTSAKRSSASGAGATPSGYTRRGWRGRGSGAGGWRASRRRWPNRWAGRRRRRWRAGNTPCPRQTRRRRTFTGRWRVEQGAIHGGAAGADRAGG